MIEFILGLILGSILATLLEIAHRISHPKIERLTNQTVSRLTPKGAIIERTEEELEQWTREIER